MCLPLKLLVPNFINEIVDIAKHINRSAKYTSIQVIYKSLLSTYHTTYKIDVSHIYHWVTGYVLISHDIFSNTSLFLTKPRNYHTMAYLRKYFSIHA